MRMLLVLWLLAVPIITAAAPAAKEAQALERQLLALINQERQARGSPPLRLNEALAGVARAHSRDMRDRKFFAHLTPEGRTPMERVLAARISCVRVGENLALDRDIARPHRVMMAEPPGQPNHRTTLLNPQYTDIGIGIVADADWLYITEEFIAVGTAGAPEWRLPDRAGAAAALNALDNRMAHLQERLGHLALQAGDIKTAEDAFQKALRADPRCAEAQAGLAEIRERSGKPDAAREAYAAAVAMDPDNLGFCLRLAEAVLAAGQSGEAEPHFLVLTRLQPENALAWYGAARCAAAAGQREIARERLRQAVTRDGALRARARAEPLLAPLVEE